MRTLTTLCIALTLLTACSEDATTPPAAPPQPAAAAASAPPAEPVATYAFAVEGMTCTHCEGVIEKKVAALPGVASVDASLKDKLATVAISDASLASDAVAEAIRAAGYKPSFTGTTQVVNPAVGAPAAP